MHHYYSDWNEHLKNIAIWLWPLLTIASLFTIVGLAIVFRHTSLLWAIFGKLMTLPLLFYSYLPKVPANAVEMEDMYIMSAYYIGNVLTTLGIVWFLTVLWRKRAAVSLAFSTNPTASDKADA
jgi:hypothetical protein